MPGSDPKTLLRELRRRRVINTTIIYFVATWLVLQAAEWALSALQRPDSAINSVWAGAVLLFPLVLIFAWHYDITRRGIRRNAPQEHSDDDQLFAADFWLIGILSFAALGVLLVTLVRIAQL